MKRKYFHFISLLTGIIATVIIAQSTSNNANIFPAYATGDRDYDDKKYKEDYYNEKEKNYDKEYNYKQSNSQQYQKQQQQKEYDREDSYDNKYNYKYKKDYYPDKEGNGPTFLAKINGDNVRPEPTDSPINGYGKVIVEEKPTTGETQLRYLITAFDVPKGEDVIAVHLHVINNEQTQTGPHIITLCGSPANEVECPEGPGVIAAGAALERDIEDDQNFITTMDQLVKALKEGLGYIQIHTDEFPEGAARGDLIEKKEKERNNNYNTY